MNHRVDCSAENCARVECSRGYQATFEAVRTAVIASKKRYICGGNIDKFEVRVAVENYLPIREVEVVGTTWRWDREHERGRVVKEGQPHNNDFLLFIPHVNNTPLLQQAINSVVVPGMNIWVVDSSADGLDLSADWLAPCTVLRLPYTAEFTHMQNAIMKKALATNVPYMLFMHSDARVHDKQVVPELIALMGEKTGVAFTNYDALACFNMDCVRQVGFWDESYSWYSSDCDYYYRVRLQGWETAPTHLGGRVDHVVSATIKTGDVLRNNQDPSSWHVGHHEHKWGGVCGVEKAVRPYGVPAESNFPPDEEVAATFEAAQRSVRHFAALASAVPSDVMARITAHHEKLNALAPSAEGNISWGSTAAYAGALWQLKSTTPQLQNKPRILNIGFNAGHSFAMFAELFPGSEIVSADLLWYPYSAAAVEYCTQNTPATCVMVGGNTLVTLSTISGKFDLILIDGGHEVDVPYADLESCKRLATPDTYVFMDDVCPQNYGLQPAAAWDWFKSKNAVTELGRWLASDSRLGFTYGKYTFEDAPQDIKVVVAHYNEDLSWLNNLRYPYTVVSKAGVPFETPPNRGQEASGYLRWIIDNYDNLPAYVIFLHGHRTSWHNAAPMDPIVNGVVCYKPYKNLNDPDPAVLGPTTSPYPECFAELSDILGTRINDNEIVFRCCAQFYVSRECILRHPLATYQKLYDWLMTTPVGSYYTSRCLEYIWHLIFTGSPVDVR